MIQFYQNIFDHLLTHWGVCLVLLITDVFLYRNHLWFSYKLRDLSLPDTPFNIISLVLFNQFLITFPVFYFLGNIEDGPFLTISNIYKIPLTFIIHECLFYYLHRLFHTSFLYKHVHKIHHRWKTPWAISATYAHPIEHLLVNILPIVIAGVLAGLNFTTLRAWHIFALLNTLISAHGGYKKLDQSNSGSMHDLHHYEFNCNYGAIGLLDNLHGTRR